MFLTLQAVCSHISKVDRTDEELLLDIASGLNVYFNYTGGATCFNRSEAATGDLSDIGWEYQVGRHASHIINVLICAKFAETFFSVVTGGGQSAPQRLPTGKFLLTYWENIGKEKKGNGGKKEGKLKKKKTKTKKERKKKKNEGEKLTMEGGKVRKWGEDFFFSFLFFFFFSLFKVTEICFGSTKTGILYRKKSFHAGKKIRKNDFAPSEKFSCYAPGSFVCRWFCFNWSSSQN